MKLDALIIIDMQEDYVGAKRNKRIYSYNTEQLIKNINARIADYSEDSVIYVTNKFLWEWNNAPEKLVKGLTIINEALFCKRWASCFSNKELLLYLQKRDIKNIEFAGVDGNHCVGSSALAGAELGFDIMWNQACIGIGNKSKFIKMENRLKKAGIRFL